MANQLLIEAVCSIAKKSQRHNQDSFFGLGRDEESVVEGQPIWLMREGSCKTSACLAGFATLLTAPPNWEATSTSLFDEAGNFVSGIACYAQEALGLTEDQEVAIFLCSNEKCAIRRLRYVAKHPNVTGDKLARRFPQESAE